MNATSGSFQPVSAQDVSWLGTDPVPAAPYYDPAYFDLEREAVFRRNWLHVGHVCEIATPGSFIRRDYEFLNLSLLVVRQKDDSIRAFHNVCTHRGTLLVADAEGRRPRFTCRYHSWTFGTDGALVSAPDFEAFNIAKKDCSLPQIRVDVVAGLIFVNLSGDAPPLVDTLGPFAAKMEETPVARATTFSEYHYEVRSNWKLCADNFQETYHLRFIHPKTGSMIMGQENPFGYPVDYQFQDQHRGQTVWFNPSASPDGPVQTAAFEANFNALAKKGVSSGSAANEYFAIFPSLFMLCDPIQNFTHVIYPLEAGRSRGVIRLYWVGEAETASEAFAREYSLMMVRDVHSEDVEAIEDGYRGLAGGGLRHIHFQTQESLCRHLFNTVDAAVQTLAAERARAGSMT